jgi:rhodanese-related sulfurtransferase
MRSRHLGSFSDMVKEITPSEFVQLRESGAQVTLVDVREDWEVKLAPAPTEFVHIPMGEIADRLGELDPGKQTVILCRSGGRSLQVARFLESKSFASIGNLSGGILAWSHDLDPSIPTY